MRLGYVTVIPVDTWFDLHGFLMHVMLGRCVDVVNQWDDEMTKLSPQNYPQQDELQCRIEAHKIQ